VLQYRLSRRAGLLGLGLVIRGLIVATPARAQAAPPGAAPGAAAPTTETRDARADEKFREGRALLDQGRFQEACQKFEESLSLASSPGTLLNLGNCYEQPGDLLRALAAFQRALAEAPREADPDRRQAWTEAAKERVQAVSERVPQLIVHPSPTPGVRVQVDGQLIQSLGVPLRLNPGKHRIDASADQKLPFIQEITLAASQKVDVTLPELEDLPSGASSVPPPYTFTPPPADSPPSPSDDSRFGVWPWALMGGGAAVFATGIVTGIVANSKASDLDEQCSAMRDASGRRICTDPALRDTRDSAETLATVTDVLWIGGLVVAGVGVTLFVLDTSDSETPAPTLEAGCFAGGCGLRASGQF
jgi:Tetratricopeptide repeat